MAAAAVGARDRLLACVTSPPRLAEAFALAAGPVAGAVEGAFEENEAAVGATVPGLTLASLAEADATVVAVGWARRHLRAVGTSESGLTPALAETALAALHPVGVAAVVGTRQCNLATGTRVAGCAEALALVADTAAIACALAVSPRAWKGLLTAVTRGAGVAEAEAVDADTALRAAEGARDHLGAVAAGVARMAVAAAVQALPVAGTIALARQGHLAVETLEAWVAEAAPVGARAAAVAVARLGDRAVVPLKPWVAEAPALPALAVLGACVRAAAMEREGLAMDGRSRKCGEASAFGPLPALVLEAERSQLVGARRLCAAAEDKDRAPPQRRRESGVRGGRRAGGQRA